MRLQPDYIEMLILRDKHLPCWIIDAFQCFGK